MTTVTTEETMPKSQFNAIQLRDSDSIGGQVLALESFAEIEKFANLMAIGHFVPKHLRNRPQDCVAVTLQSLRWQMDPFAVAQKTYFVNDGIGYEAQLVNAVVLSRAPLKGRLQYTWDGEGEKLTCTVSGTFKGEDMPSSFTAEMATITTRNSPLWKQQPRQQLAYFATRAWARIYCPDVILGVYTPEERAEIVHHYGPDNALNVTPAEESSVISNINKQAAAEKAQTAPVIDNEEPAYDPETGEVFAKDSNDAQALTKAFDIADYDLSKAGETKKAISALCKLLEKTEQDERGGIFVQNGGRDILAVAGSQGLGMDKAKFKDLGINM